MYRAGGWLELGGTRGYARSNGRCTEPHGRPKRIPVRSLRRDARRLLSREAPASGPELAERGAEAMRSLYDELAAMPDHRRAQGRKHPVACVPAVHVLAVMANMRGCLAAGQFARSLSPEQLAAVGAWENPETGLREPARHRRHVDLPAFEPPVRLRRLLRAAAGPSIMLLPDPSALGMVRWQGSSGGGGWQSVCVDPSATVPLRRWSHRRACPGARDA